ncbi:hypothetical protein [Lelliottia amnigena]|uniref:hypothetical protein n=1 Tax=Lelliottia amnigena TaxID=61646 RepID=UPI001C245B8A|nr:hypothetical protein [Lelliottia amnigena]QXB22141.1 hypothetical protein I6L76_01980 [Lelliottia amnigena]
MKKNIVVICIDYHSHDESTDYIKNILEKNSRVNVILVCNSGKEKFDDEFLSHNRLHVYDFGKNLGYMQAAHLGLSEYVKSNGVPDWTILSNTDITLEADSFFSILECDNRTDSIIAPEIISIDGYHQNPFLIYRPSLRKLNFLKLVYSNPITFNLYSKLSNLKLKFKKRQCGKKPGLIYASHGSFIIIGQYFFKSGLSLEHPMFLYGEELLLAERARTKNINTIYDPGYKVLHHEHIATGKLASSFKAKCLHDSIDCVIKNYYMNEQ